MTHRAIENRTGAAVIGTLIGVTLLVEHLLGVSSSDNAMMLLKELVAHELLTSVILVSMPIITICALLMTLLYRVIIEKTPGGINHELLPPIGMMMMVGGIHSLGIVLRNIGGRDAEIAGAAAGVSIGMVLLLVMMAVYDERDCRKADQYGFASAMTLLLVLTHATLSIADYHLRQLV
ncbi:hypothetical protein HGA91_05400 [candidate division WWE3 bacterium]|nr:hypothetical protein [candidate division WWE3 bacterium]